MPQFDFCDYGDDWAYHDGACWSTQVSGWFYRVSHDNVAFQWLYVIYWGA